MTSIRFEDYSINKLKYELNPHFNPETTKIDITPTLDLGLANRKDWLNTWHPLPGVLYLIHKLIGGIKMTFMMMGFLFIGAVIYGAGVLINWLEEGGY